MKRNCVFLEKSLLSLFCHIQGAARVAQEFLNQHLTGITPCLTFLRGCMVSWQLQGLSGLGAGYRHSRNSSSQSEWWGKSVFLGAARFRVPVKLSRSIHRAVPATLVASILWYLCCAAKPVLKEPSAYPKKGSEHQHAVLYPLTRL